MKIDKQEIVELLRSRGEDDTADHAEARAAAGGRHRRPPCQARPAGHQPDRPARRHRRHLRLGPVPAPRDRGHGSASARGVLALLGVRIGVERRRGLGVGVSLRLGVGRRRPRRARRASTGAGGLELALGVVVPGGPRRPARAPSVARRSSAATGAACSASAPNGPTPGAPPSVASMLRTLLSWAVMLSRRAVAAASSRSESRRMRSACSLADETSAAASARAASSSRDASAALVRRSSSASRASRSARSWTAARAWSCVRHLRGELGGRLLAALAEGALEVGGGGGGGRPLLLEVGLGLLAAGGGLAGGVVDDRVGLPLGPRDRLGRVDVGARADLLGVAVGLGAH